MYKKHWAGYSRENTGNSKSEPAGQRTADVPVIRRPAHVSGKGGCQNLPVSLTVISSTHFTQS